MEICGCIANISYQIKITNFVQLYNYMINKQNQKEYIYIVVCSCVCMCVCVIYDIKNILINK